MSSLGAVRQTRLDPMSILKTSRPRQTHSVRTGYQIYLKKMRQFTPELSMIEKFAGPFVRYPNNELVAVFSGSNYAKYRAVNACS